MKLQDKANALEDGLLHSAEIHPIPLQFSEVTDFFDFFFLNIGKSTASTSQLK